MFSLKSAEDRDDMEWFQDIVDEFNSEVTQELWNEFYNQVKNQLIEYYKKEITDSNEKIQKLINDGE